MQDSSYLVVVCQELYYHLQILELSPTSNPVEQGEISPSSDIVAPIPGASLDDNIVHLSLILNDHSCFRIYYIVY